MKTNPSERGQTLVLIALALIAIFGFAALAIDGGRLYSERRRAQNAADSAAYAAASAAVDDGNAITAALTQAELNGYLDAYPAADPTQYMDVIVKNPPEDGPYQGDNTYYQVKIRTRVDQAFSQIIYPNGLEIQVEAVSHLEASRAPGGEAAIRATSPNACQAIKVHGTTGVKVHGGDVTSDSDADGTPASCDSIVTDSAAADLTVKAGQILSVGSQDFHTGTVHVDDPAVDIDDFADTGVFSRVPYEPYCDDLPDAPAYHGGDGVLKPGVYPNGIKISGKNTDVLMEPGIYCLYGGTNGGLIVTGGNLAVAHMPADHSTPTEVGTPENDKGVLIYIAEGSVDLGGQGKIDLWAPQDLKDGAGHQWAGMLFFMSRSNTGTIHITGGAGTSFTGTIYAPDPASPITQDKCFIEGTSAPYSLNSAIYCYTIKIGGRSSVQVNYRPDQNYKNPDNLDLSQ